MSVAGSARAMTGRATRRATDTVSVMGFKLGWRAVRALPERAAYTLFNGVADVVHRRDGRGVRQLRANYARARPELSPRDLESLVRAGLRSYMRYYCEAFRLPTIDRAAIDRAVVAHGAEELQERSARGEPVVVFVGHLGNFDLGAAWSASNIAPVTTVAERLRPEEVYQEFLAFRRSIDMNIIPLTGGEDPFVALVRAVREEGRLVALASDRDLTDRGIEVELVGHRVRMAKGPAVLSLLTGAPLYAATIHYEPAPGGEGLGGYRTVVRFSERLVPRVTGSTADKAQDLIQQCADHLTPVIRAHTSSWHMLQKIFVEDLDADRLASVPSGPSGPSGRSGPSGPSEQGAP